MSSAEKSSNSKLQTYHGYTILIEKATGPSHGYLGLALHSFLF